MNKGALICLTGIDGSGKTTLAKGLAQSLQEEGIEARYVYARYAPLLLRPLMRLGECIFLRGHDPETDYAGYSRTKREVTGQRRFLSLVYQTILMADYFLQILIKVWWPMLQGQSVVCDRYVYDTMVNDLALDFNHSQRSIDAILDGWMRFVPRPGLVVLVDVPEEVAFRRKHDIPSIEYVRERRPLYQYMARKLRMLTLDGTKEPGELKAIVLREALNRVGHDGKACPATITGASQH